MTPDAQSILLRKKQNCRTFTRFKARSLLIRLFPANDRIFDGDKYRK
jgi:hypothetical protein